MGRKAERGAGRCGIYKINGYICLFETKMLRYEDMSVGALRKGRRSEDRLKGLLGRTWLRDVEMWRCGDVEMWRCGDVEMRDER